VEVAADRGDCYAYVRPGGTDDEPLLVVLNFGDAEARMQVTLPDGFETFARAKALADVLNDEELPGLGAGTTISGGSARVLAAVGAERP
jgi:hypothetical protein